MWWCNSTCDSTLLIVTGYMIIQEDMRRGGNMNRTPSHAYFLAHLYTHLLRTCTCMAQGVVARVFVKRALIHMSSRVWLCVVSPPIELFFSFECLCILSNFLHFLSSPHHPPCGRNCRVINPLCTRRTRSMALWRYNTLSQAMSPSSSTTSTTQRLIQRSSKMNPST